MNYRVIAVLAAATMTLAGCASTSSYTTKNARYDPPPMESDLAYINAVENAARRSGVGVVWIHPPRKGARPDSR